MATRKEILKDIRSLYGNALSESKVALYLGKSRGVTFRELQAANIPRYELDRKNKTYLAIDIADFVYQRQTFGSLD